MLRDVDTKSKRKPEHFSAVRIDRERLEQLKELARREDRSVAAVLRRLVDAEMEREETAA